MEWPIVAYFVWLLLSGWSGYRPAREEVNHMAARSKPPRRDGANEPLIIGARLALAVIQLIRLIVPVFHHADDHDRWWWPWL
jgi:hypothetical protein